MTGGVVGDGAQGLIEIGPQLAVFVADHEIFERVVNVLANLLHLGVIREHKGQFLLKHQHAGRDGRDDVPTLVHQLHEDGDVLFHVGLNAIQVAQLQFGHTAAFFLVRDSDGDAVMLEYRHQVHADVGFVDIVVAGGKEGHLASGGTRLFAINLATHLANQLFTQGVVVILGEAGIAMHPQHHLQGLASHV